MKYFYVLAVLALIAGILVACGGDDEPEVDVQSTVEAALESTQVAQPSATPQPDLDATVVWSVQATLDARPVNTPEADLISNQQEGRPHRSYPAPTGYPGFRRYYQKRCYPGCHTYGDEQPHP
jgi:hypothetical protein